MPDQNQSIFDHLPIDIQNQIATKCNSQECKDAENSVITSRNSEITACSNVARLNGDRNFFATLAGSLWAAVAAAAVGAAVTPWPFNLVLWIVAGLLAIGAAIATGFAADAQQKLNLANMALATAQQTFAGAVAAVMKSCDNNCYPDLTEPSCP
jgi:hypothetical protein